MKNYRLCLGSALLLTALRAFAADAGVFTIVDGPSRVLRGSVWYLLAAGAAALKDGDAIEATGRAQVHLELASGGTLNLVGPGALFSACVDARPSFPEAP